MTRSRSPRAAGELATREILVRFVSAVASLAIGVAFIVALSTPADAGVVEGPPPPVPAIAFPILELSCAAIVGMIGAIRGSRPLIGAAGGLILPLGLVGSLLVIPAVVLIGAYGLAPGKQAPQRSELAAGVLIVLLGIAIFVVPALTRSARCWVATPGPTGIAYEMTDQMPDQLGDGQIGAGCDSGVPSPVAFPIAILLVGAALALAVLSSNAGRRHAAG